MCIRDSSQGLSNWCQIELAQDYNIAQLQSIVIYNRISSGGSTERIQNCRIDLINHNGEIIILHLQCHHYKLTIFI